MTHKIGCDQADPSGFWVEEGPTCNYPEPLMADDLIIKREQPLTEPFLIFIEDPVTGLHR